MKTEIITEELMLQNLKKIPTQAHKGSNGTLNIVAGSEKFRGAADLSVGGALRTGVGIVRLISQECVVALVASRHPSCTFLPVADATERKNAIFSCSGGTFLIGCGLGMNTQTASDVANVLSVARSAVLDADALNVISASPELFKKLSGFTVTPHVGELSRLTGASIEEIKGDLVKHALNFSKKFGCVTVLKDHVTAIASPTGESYVSKIGSAGLSKGGSGDVLAGIITGFNARGFSAIKSAIIGTALHSLASKECEKEYGVTAMLPSDLEHHIASVLSRAGF